MNIVENKPETRKRFMPMWQNCACGAGESFAKGLADPEERDVALAAHRYFQGDLAQTIALCSPLRESKSLEIRLSALLLHMMACVPLGDAASKQRNVEMFQWIADHAETDEQRAILRFIQNVLSVFFHTDEKLSIVKIGWMGNLSPCVRLFALYGVAHGLYLQKDYAQSLGVARSALIMADDACPSVCIYLNLIAAISAMNLNKTDQADGFFLRAWSLAEADGYLHPFAEHHGMLQGQIERHFRDRKPELYRQISEMVVRFSRGWMKIHNPISTNKVTDALTPYEFSVAMLAAKGRSNKEIADYLNISTATVKGYLSVIYQKVCVKNRSELAFYVNK